MKSSGTSNLLVIGYGNTLRRDDGVGVRVAERVEAIGLPGVRTLVSPQLTPEMADEISKAGAVVFVDASAEGPRAHVSLRHVAPAESSRVLTHTEDPGTLLALARDVFGRAPPAWALTVPAEAIGFGEELSPVARGGLAKAVKRLRDFQRRRVHMGHPHPARA
jgi:hydrogenase maturation protease